MREPDGRIETTGSRQPWYKSPYVQVLIAIGLGIAIGYFYPDFGEELKPLGDKFMSECRALTNLIGNGVACVVISRSGGELDEDKLHETMAHPIQLGEPLEPGNA
jgi:Na+/H+-dicarboxylate symporter